MNEPRKPPYSEDAEKALLGSLLLSQDVYYEIIDTISADSFYSPKHKIIFEGLQTLAERNEPFDIITLSRVLENRNQLSSIGGSEYLAELTSFVPSASNATHYAGVVHDQKTKRNIIEVGGNISQLGYKNDYETVEEVINAAEKMMFDITQQRNRKEYTKLGDKLTGVYEEMEKIQKDGNSLRGITSGFKSIDSKLAGFQKSDLIILAARPSVGKTTLALDIARKVAVKEKIPVAIFSLEMSNAQLVERMLASEAMVDAWRLRTGSIQKENSTEMGDIRDALGRLSEAPIFMDDRPGNNILSIRSTARRMKKENNIQLIIVDYLQLITPFRTMRSDSMVNQVTEISRTLKHIARELEVPVIALSQLSREIEKRGGTPRLSDLRDSGSIEQDADVVMFLHKDKKGDDMNSSNQVVDLLIEKHRNGPTGRLSLSFNKEKVTFLDIDRKHSETNYQYQSVDNTEGEN